MGMFDVADKQDTLREAYAQATVHVNPETIKLVKEGKSPKGDIVETARIAATMAAKRTSDIIPYCHPIPIDYIKIDVNLKETTIEVLTEVKTVWKTGVEMEALTAASVAALTVYDMLKPVDESMSIGQVTLIRKSGGLKSFQEKYERALKAAVLVVSDSASKGERQDKSGKVATEKLQQNGFTVDHYKILPDDAALIQAELKRLCDDQKVDLIVTCGGTGLGPRDVTTEATQKVLEREVKGVSEAIRAYGQRRTPLSMLSRGICGVRGKTVIVNLPGSPKAVGECLTALFPGISHIYSMIEGRGH
jgi:molybdenum cofactor biosynthesis protein MoaC